MNKHDTIWRARTVFISIALAALASDGTHVAGQGAQPTGARATASPTTPAPAAAPPVTALTDTGWPREIRSGQTTLTVYQPQLDEWDGFHLSGRSAVAAREGSAQTPVYGIVRFTSQTHVDKETRLVNLEKFTITHVNFPQQGDKSKGWVSIIEGRAARLAPIALDRLEAAKSLADAERRGDAVPFRNDPPRIIVSPTAAMLVPIDGEAVYRPVAGTSLTRVINTRPLLLRDTAGAHYLKIFDGWMRADSLTAEWVVITNVPAECDTALKTAISEKTADLLVGGDPDDAASRPSLKKQVPRIYVETKPTELLVTDGAPKYVPIEGTELVYAENTTGNLFIDTASQRAFVLFSGRWFSGPSSLQGPWEFVPGGKLPASFAAIPDASAKENVKASIPGTPQAEEAVVANSIPQTAKVKRSGASFAPTYDGAPKLDAIAGTDLRYVVNASLPIIALAGATEYFGVQNGVWFVSNSLQGPWLVATKVPEVIYSIPPSSSMHYVTYVRVYDYTPEYVVVGYTPGYYGTYVSSGTVVYGTGYPYTPWIGSVWYGPPVTYGFGVNVCYTPWGGWAMGFGFGWAWGATTVAVGWGWGPYPWWGPAAYPWGVAYPWVYSPVYGAAWGVRGGAVWGPGYWSGTTGNVYSRWGAATAVTRTSGGYNAWTGNRWASQSGMAYNSRTGTLAAGQRAAVGNAYTGNYAAGRAGTAVNARTGVTATGGSVTAGNVYTGRQATAGRATVTGTGGQSTTVSGIRGEQGGVARVGDDVYAGRDGNVYRRGADGNWQQSVGGARWEGSSGINTQRLDAERRSRAAGESRYGNYRSGGFRSAGGMRAGGGRRR